MSKKTFEESMSMLEKIVEELETGDLPIEKALKKFEEGIRLSKFCSDTLDETEKKIMALIQNPDGTIAETPFATKTDEAAENGE